MTCVDQPAERARCRWSARSGRRAARGARPRRPGRPARRRARTRARRASPGPAAAGGCVGVAAAAGLDAGLLVGGDHELVGRQRLPLPARGVQVEDPPRLGAKSGSRGKIQLRWCHGPDRVLVQPAPDGAAADRRHEPPLRSRRPSRACSSATAGRTRGRQLTRDGLDRDDHLWGEKLGADPSVADRRGRRAGPRRSVSARATRPRGAWASRRSRRSTSPRRRAESSWRAALGDRRVYFAAGRSTSVLRPPTAQCDRGSTEASSTQRSRAEYRCHVSALGTRGKYVAELVKRTT